MRHRKKGKILSREIGPRKALFRGLVTQLVLYEKIRTTEAKAKAIRPMVEKLTTRAKHGKSGDLAVLRSYFLVPGAGRKLREVIAPRYASRAGGYTRIIKVGQRTGDGAKTVIIEFV